MRRMRHTIALFTLLILLIACGKKKGTPAPKAQVNEPPKEKTSKPEPPPVEPSNPSSAAAIEQGIRTVLEKPTGELSAADLAMV